MSSFNNATLMITGGTGSFGSTVLKHFLDSDLKEIRIFSRDEKKQDDMRHELQAKHPEAAKKVKFYIGDVRNPQSIKDAMPGVDYIFHAAALKQVPSCEFFPMQAVQTNIIGTDNVLHAAIDAGVKRVVCLSTDKAAYPINAMGISKAMMEHVIFANARVAAERGGTTICCTRYGNVMCSRGSVIPLFIDQIKAGNPITITDPNMTRFLMNLDEAVDLVMFAFNPQSIKDAMPGVDYIFHAAALKQVPSCEFFPMQAVQTNIIGTDNVLHAAIDAGVKRVVCLSTDKAAYPINAMGISKAMMEHVIFANARVAAERGGTTICCTRYGNVMCSRGSVIPLFIDQIKAGNPITITDPNMTRFLMNLDEAVDLVMFAFQHGNPGDLFIQKSDASTIGDLAKAVQQLFGDTGTNIIGTRHGEKLFETLMTREERLRSEDMGHYFRVAADNRDLNYDKFVVKGEVHTMADESYTSHNTTRLDVEGTVKKIMTTEYVQNELKGVPNV